MFNLSSELPIQFASGPETADILGANEKRIRLLTRTLLYLVIMTNILSTINRIIGTNSRGSCIWNSICRECFIASIDSEEALENFPFRAYRPKFVPEQYLSTLHCFLVLWNATSICANDSIMMVFLNEMISQLMGLDYNLRYISAH